MERLAAWSQEHGWTKSQAVRAAVRALTRAKDEDALLSLSGVIHDGLPADCSEQFDRYLQETFVAERATAYKQRRRRARTRG
ncbi:MAG: hypothetical protein ACE5I7_03125 [Candidatus Binatia bacterium]